MKSGDQLAAIEEVKALASEMNGRSGLDSRHLTCLKASVQCFCESVVEVSFSDFQVALFGEEQTVQDSLKEAGVSQYTLKKLQTSPPNASCFAVVLSCRQDLQKIVALQSSYKPLQHMGVRLPPISWVSKFCQNALDSWKPHVRRACKEDDVIEYKESFGQEIASRYEPGNNCFSAAGEQVELRVRFSLVLFPISFAGPEDMYGVLQSALPDVTLNLDSLMLLEDKGEHSNGGKIAILSGDAFNDTYSALTHPKTLTVKCGEQRFSVLAVSWSDWVYTFANLGVLRSQWEAVQHEICASAKRQARRDLLCRVVCRYVKMAEG